jgi:hypothetical protein
MLPFTSLSNLILCFGKEEVIYLSTQCQPTYTPEGTGLVDLFPYTKLKIPVPLAIFGRYPTIKTTTHAQGYCCCRVGFRFHRSSLAHMYISQLKLSSKSEAEISKNYCATNSSSPEVELRFCPWIILFKY